MYFILYQALLVVLATISTLAPFLTLPICLEEVEAADLTFKLYLGVPVAVYSVSPVVGVVGVLEPIVT